MGTGLAGGADNFRLGEPLGVGDDGFGDGVSDDGDDVGRMLGGILEGDLPGLVVIFADHGAQRTAGGLNGAYVVGERHHDGNVLRDGLEHGRNVALERDAGG